MTLAELAEHHKKGAEACEAYARTDCPKPDIAKHYEKRAKWHREAMKLLLDLESSRLT